MSFQDEAVSSVETSKCRCGDPHTIVRPLGSRRLAGPMFHVSSLSVIRERIQCEATKEIILSHRNTREAFESIQHAATVASPPDLALWPSFEQECAAD